MLSRSLLSIAAATLVLATACTDGANLPTSAIPAEAESARTLYAANAPNGTHFQAGTSASCSLVGLTISCTSYQLAGVGNANAAAALTADYSATVDCRNHGGKVVAVKSQVKAASVSTGLLEPKNGRMSVPALTSGAAPSNSTFESSATCPNGNWTKQVRSGTAVLTGYVYTLTFVGFSGPYIVLP